MWIYTRTLLTFVQWVLFGVQTLEWRTARKHADFCKLVCACLYAVSQEVEERVQLAQKPSKRNSFTLRNELASCFFAASAGQSNNTRRHFYKEKWRTLLWQHMPGANIISLAGTIPPTLTMTQTPCLGRLEKPYTLEWTAIWWTEIVVWTCHMWGSFVSGIPVSLSVSTFVTMYNTSVTQLVVSHPEEGAREG